MSLFFKGEPIPVLKTKRLTLRAMHVSDYADMFEYSKRSDVTKYLLWFEHPTCEYTRHYLKRVQKMYKSNEYYDWAIIYNGDENDSDILRSYRGRMIGTCGFASMNEANASGEIGYVLNHALWGNGIIPEAAREVIRFGFGSLGLNRIEAKYISGNERSEKVMKKIGMTYEGMHRDYMIVKGHPKDIGIYAILRSDVYR